MHDLERCSVCPDEITKGEPGISIIDNDDFLNDTLAGGGIAHHCNWMFQQHIVDRREQPNAANIQDEDPRIKDAKTVSQALTESVRDAGSYTIYDSPAW
jgi:hypothetical protein